MNHRAFAFVLGVTFFLAAPAFAQTGTATPPPKKNHHCVLKGTDIQATKKECLSKGGSWLKTAPTTAPAPAPAPSK